MAIAMSKSLQRIVTEKERTIRQLKHTIRKLEESKVVNITHIEHVQSFFSSPVASSAQSDVVMDVGGQEEVAEADTDVEHENLIFKKFMDGKPLNMKALFNWIARSFVPLLNANY